jgi:hypothetical protein
MRVWILLFLRDVRLDAMQKVRAKRRLFVL